MAMKDVSIAYAEATGSFLVLLAIAEQQGFFQKYGVNVRSVAVRGATIPRLTADMPLGMIGEPAALLQAAEGADLRLVASFSDIKLSGHLVARPGIKTPADLSRQAIGSARDRRRTLDINGRCPRTVGARSTARRKSRFCPWAVRCKSSTPWNRAKSMLRWCQPHKARELQAKGFRCPLERLPARHKQLWRGAGCLQWLSVEQSRCRGECRACTSGSPGALPWRTEQGEGHAGIQDGPQHLPTKKALQAV